MRKPLLLLPGPMQLPDHVQTADNSPLFSHRSAEMDLLPGRLGQTFRSILGTKGNVITFKSFECCLD